MARVILGAVAAALAMFALGFLLYGTPLQRLSHGTLDDNAATAVQQSLATAGLETGTYFVPNPTTSTQTSLYARGPIATIHFNERGYPALDAAALAGGLVLDFLVALLIGAGLIGLDRGGFDRKALARAVILFAIAASAYIHLSEPLLYHHPWARFLYTFVADAAVLALGGWIIARFFLPRAKAEAAPSVQQL